MNKRLLIPFLSGIAFIVLTARASAQMPGSTGSPLQEAKGKITGVLVNRSPGGTIPLSLSIMLHILDRDYNQVGMLHTRSQPDGSFLFEDVPLDPNEFYAGIVSYKGATYYSQPVPYDGRTAPNLEIPIYETTKDVSKLQIDEIHVLFNFAEDGLEVSEIYALSNLDDYTITGTLTLADGTPATIKFPLPAQADYVFFKPDATDRFVKLDKGFADKAPLLPGEGTSSMMVSYLLPYTGVISYSYTAPVSVQNLDYLIPAEQEVLLDGPLTGPEITTLQDNSVYQVYSYQGLAKGQTIQFGLFGRPNLTGSSADRGVTVTGVVNKDLAVELGSSFIGLAMIGVGVWQWRKSRQQATDVTAEEEKS